MKPVITRRRIVITMFVVLALIALFVVRLVDIQVVRAAALNEQSSGKMSSPSTVYGVRGDISDRNGIILAQAQMRYNVTASPRNAKDFERTVDGKKVTVTPAQAASEIGRITGQFPNEIIDILNRALQENAESDFVYITKGVELATYRALDALDIPWLYFESAPSRVYPNGAVAGNLIGYVGSDGKPLAGLEQTANECVGSTDGQQTYERGADGIMIPGSNVVSKQAVNGGKLKLTIDADLQWYSQQVLAKQVKDQRGSWGIAVILEVKTGKLISVADYPSVDPNNVDGTADRFRGSLAFSAPYEPGSTMKSLTSGMLLDAGKASASSRVNAPYEITFPNGANFHDSGHHNPHLTLAGVMVESSNVGISKLADSLSPSVRYDYMTKYGLGSATNVNFLGESEGILRPSREWDNQTHYTTMFGQGFTATAVQMASAYQAIANGGVRIPVTLVDGCTKPNGDYVPAKTGDSVKVISPEAARGVVDMMENVASQGWLRDKFKIPGYRVAAKTGTAQQSNGQGGYSKSYIVTIAGMVPAGDPKYVILTTIADASLNSTAAVAPVFHDLAVQVLKHYRIQPSTSGASRLRLYY